MGFGLLFSLLPFLFLFVVVRAVTGRGKGAIGGHPVRHFFQYMLLYGLTVITAMSLTGLLERAIPHPGTIYGMSSDLAANLAGATVGLPLLVLIGRWTQRRFQVEPAEKDAFAWGIYLAFAGLTSLVVAMQSIQSSLLWLLGRGGDVSSDVSMAVVWTGVWAVHWWLDRRVTPHGQTRLHHGIGSIVSLVWSAVGLGMLLAATLHVALPLQGESLYDAGGNPFGSAAATLVVGALAWYCYWVRTYAKSARDVLWDVYVMVVGIAGGLVTAVVSASVVLYDVLVWWFGNTTASGAAEHFRSVPGSLAAALVGVLVWWYHRALLAENARPGRTEGQRIYEYLVAAIGLLAAAVGLFVMFAALIETMTAGAAIVGDQGPRNTLLLAVTLLAVGGPVWWLFWRRLETAVAADRATECVSPARRFYLFMLFGIGGSAAVVSLLVGVYELFNDVVAGDFGADTLRNMRWALGVLIAAGAVAGYHWLVYRGERDIEVLPSGRMSYVLLVGAPDPAIGRAVAEATGAHVDVWGTTAPAAGWSAEAVLAALQSAGAVEAVVVSELGELRAIPVQRR